MSTCIRPERSFLDLQTGEVAVHQQSLDAVRFQYVGATYQCVECARKSWMKNRHLTFGDVDSAYNRSAAICWSMWRVVGVDLEKAKWHWPKKATITRHGNNLTDSLTKFSYLRLEGNTHCWMCRYRLDLSQITP